MSELTLSLIENNQAEYFLNKYIYYVSVAQAKSVIIALVLVISHKRCRVCKSEENMKQMVGEFKWC